MAVETPNRYCHTCDGTGFCWECKDNDGRCRDYRDHEYVGPDGQRRRSHDAYGNRYGDHPCHICHGTQKCTTCKGVGRGEFKCTHDTLMVQGGGHFPTVQCMGCGQVFTAFPAQVVTERGMYDVLKDALLQDRHKEAETIVQSYLDWRIAQTASEKQGRDLSEYRFIPAAYLQCRPSTNNIVPCPHCHADNRPEARSARYPAECFYCHGLGRVIEQPIGSGG